MEILIEKIIIYSAALALCGISVWLYLRRERRTSKLVEAKIKQAKEAGLFEPISLHPVIDLNRCINSGACVAACPEKDILGIRNGRATIINASQCIGHGACFHACPVEAISLCIGTEKRGVELPHVNEHFETNVQGIYIAGELGGMGLIKNATEQGRQAVENIARSLKENPNGAQLDLIIIGAGPAGISASLTAKKMGLNFLTLEQDTLGGTVFTFPRSKVVMTAPMNLSLHGRVKLYETSKRALLDLWESVLHTHKISIREKSKVDCIKPVNGYFKVELSAGESFTTKSVLVAIGRRGTPRKLNVPGEDLEKVAYRLLEPENIRNKNILVVGGGDSAIESALLLAETNQVILSYRGDSFKRIKPKNGEKIHGAINKRLLEVKFNSNLVSISEQNVVISVDSAAKTITVQNDLVYIFAGGELPSGFLEKAGIKVTKRFGHTVLKHNRN